MCVCVRARIYKSRLCYPHVIVLYTFTYIYIYIDMCVGTYISLGFATHMPSFYNMGVCKCVYVNLYIYILPSPPIFRIQRHFALSAYTYIHTYIYIYIYYLPHHFFAFDAHHFAVNAGLCSACMTRATARALSLSWVESQCSCTYACMYVYMQDMHDTCNSTRTESELGRIPYVCMYVCVYAGHELHVQ